MAEEVRWSRELMGIHYPSDNEASRVIGWHLLDYWYNNPQFVTDMERAKMEWATKKNSAPTKAPAVRKDQHPGSGKSTP